MFLSLRLAALTLSFTAFFISNVYGVPLFKRFVSFSNLDQSKILESERSKSSRSEQLCNLRSEFCDRKYGNITFVGAHDSFAASPNPFAREWLKLPLSEIFLVLTNSALFAVSRTQEVDVSTQLRMGVRLLQAQAHMCVSLSFVLFGLI